jgi:hypothetical protein
MVVFRVFPPRIEERKMFSSRTKSLIIVFMLLALTGLITVGCGKKGKYGWVNTDSMPGKTFSRMQSNARKPAVIDLSNDDEPNVNFGPKDVSFKFKDLK